MSANKDVTEAFTLGYISSNFSMTPASYQPQVLMDFHEEIIIILLDSDGDPLKCNFSANKTQIESCQQISP